MKLVDPSALTELVIPFYALITSSSAPQHPFDPLKQATHRVMAPCCALKVTREAKRERGL